MFFTKILLSRPEQQRLRMYLLNNYPSICSLCEKKYPNFMLDCAHIKPRSKATKREINDNNIVFLLCKNCHHIYDRGYISVNKNEIIKHDLLYQYPDLIFDNIYFNNYNYFNEKYFDYHYHNIFKHD